MSESNSNERGEATGSPTEGGCHPASLAGMGSLFDQLRTAHDFDDVKIARARELLKDDGYPPDSILLQIARHLAEESPTNRSEGSNRQGN